MTTFFSQPQALSERQPYHDAFTSTMRTHWKSLGIGPSFEALEERPNRLRSLMNLSLFTP